MSHERDDPAEPRRRQLLAALALGFAGAPWAASAQATRPPGLLAAEVCRLFPEMTEGPFYFDPRLDRGDVTEGRAGVPLDLAVQIVGPDCAPLSGARVDIWQCDALGLYSGTSASPGTTFLRGIRMTDGDGIARFRTIYPGWYRGRAPHIHFKAALDEASVLTSQIFLPDDLSARVYATAPYAERRGRQDTFYANDRIAASAGPGTMATVEIRSDRLAASLVAGVDPHARG